MKRIIPTLNDYINEASHPGRAWSGKLERLDKLLAWMYDHNILNKGEKSKKDSIFRQYYRYYNDGDFPKGLQAKGINSFSRKEVIEKELETMVEDFIKEILSKYQGKYNRQEFMYDDLLSELYTLNNVIKDYDVYGFLNYWSKKTKIADDAYDKAMTELRKIYDSLDKAANDDIAKHDFGNTPSYNRPGPSYTISYRRDQMKNLGIWNDKLEKDYTKMTDICDEIKKIIDTVIEATQKAKEVVTA